MSKLGLAIKERNKAGYLGLIACIIPGFPDIAISQQVTQFLDKANSITSLEFTLPAIESFSQSANQKIIDSNQQAVRINTERDIQAWLQSDTPNFIMFYREAIDRVGFEGLVKQFSKDCSGVMLEWDETDISSYWETCNKLGIELLIAVNPQMTEQELQYLSQFIFPEGVVYFICAPQAGGKRYTTQEIATCIQRIKTQRPDVVIAASMGIRTPDDIREMASIPGIDAVVIGTAFFEVTEQGLSAVQAYLNTIEPALSAFHI